MWGFFVIFAKHFLNVESFEKISTVWKTQSSYNIFLSSGMGSPEENPELRDFYAAQFAKKSHRMLCITNTLNLWLASTDGLKIASDNYNSKTGFWET